MAEKRTHKEMYEAKATQLEELQAIHRNVVEANRMIGEQLSSSQIEVIKLNERLSIISSISTEDTGY